MHLHPHDRQSLNSPEDVGKRSHTMNTCSYHEEGFLFARLSIGEMRWGVCGFRVWGSPRDAVPTEWKEKA